MKILVKLFDIVEKLIQMLCTFLLLVMVVVIFAQVINRTLFAGAFYWAEASAILSMVWLCMLGSVCAVRHGNHTRIDFVVGNLKGVAQKMLETVNCLTCAAFSFALGWYTLPFIESMSKKVIVSLPFFNRSIYFWAIILGSFLMVAFWLLRAVLFWIPESADNLDNALEGGSKE